MPSRRSIRCTIYLVAVLIMTAVALVLWVKFGPEYEACSPDHFDFGTVEAGSSWEFSARFLTIDQKSFLERLGERVASRCPPSWQPAVRRWTTRKRPVEFPTLDLSRLQPNVRAPDFIIVSSVAPQQNQYWYQGRSYVSAQLRLDTSKPGTYAGRVKVILGRRQSSLPVRVRVRPAAGGERVLVASTPYEEYATEDGARFDGVTQVLSSLASVDCVRQLPPTLDRYRTILLGDSALAGIVETDIARVRAFAEKGGRVILPCNAFFQNTIPKANQILAGHGLTVITNDMAGVHHATNIVVDALTRGVTRLEFHRPSPIVGTNTTKARLLALDPGGAGGFVAVVRLRGGGEMVVIGASLWWNWVGEFEDNPDNARLLRNALAPPGTN